MNLPKSVLTKSQTKNFSKSIQYNGRTCTMNVKVRYDDQCGNGHNSFSITGEIIYKSHRNPEVCGCIHEEIEKYFPELKKYINWHLVSSDGPLHYIANTIYHAEEDKSMQHFVYYSDGKLIKNHLIGLFSDKELPKVYKDYPAKQLRIKSKPTYSNRKPDLKAARSCAIWPDATLEQLRSKKALEDRLPKLMNSFKKAIEELGFKY